MIENNNNNNNKGVSKQLMFAVDDEALLVYIFTGRTYE